MSTYHINGIRSADLQLDSPLTPVFIGCVLNGMLSASLAIRRHRYSVFASDSGVFVGVLTMTSTPVGTGTPISALVRRLAYSLKSVDHSALFPVNTLYWTDCCCLAPCSSILTPNK